MCIRDRPWSSRATTLSTSPGSASRSTSWLRWPSQKRPSGHTRKSGKSCDQQRLWTSQWPARIKGKCPITKGNLWKKFTKILKWFQRVLKGVNGHLIEFIERLIIQWHVQDVDLRQLIFLNICHIITFINIVSVPWACAALTFWWWCVGHPSRWVLGLPPTRGRWSRLPLGRWRSSQCASSCSRGASPWSPPGARRLCRNWTKKNQKVIIELWPMTKLLYIRQYKLFFRGNVAHFSTVGIKGAKQGSPFKNKLT